jgi:hypothetical protein
MGIPPKTQGRLSSGATGPCFLRCPFGRTPEGKPTTSFYVVSIIRLLRPGDKSRALTHRHLLTRRAASSRSHQRMWELEVSHPDLPGHLLSSPRAGAIPHLGQTHNRVAQIRL